MGSKKTIKIKNQVILRVFDFQKRLIFERLKRADLNQGKYLWFCAYHRSN